MLIYTGTDMISNSSCAKFVMPALNHDAIDIVFTYSDKC